MSPIVRKLARQQLAVAQPSAFDLERSDTELRRLTDAGTVLLLAKGLYALVPENQRTPGTTWLPTIEGAALGIAAAFYTPNDVALVGPSAARAHRQSAAGGRPGKQNCPARDQPDGRRGLRQQPRVTDLDP